jgi:hypothetical protein
MVANSTPKPASPSPFRRRNVAPAERVSWETWREWFGSEWKQDEHMSIIGPTGTGKTALAVELLKIRTYKVFVMTKPADDKLARALDRQHYVKVPAFPRNPPDDIDRYFLWPPGSGDLSPDGLQKQRTILRDAFVKIFRGPGGGQPGRWCICLDEARYVSDPAYLGLRREVNQLLIQGRSLRISVVLNFQRPSWVPPEAYDQASHLFIAQDNDRRNVQRFREIGGVDGDRVAATVQTLKRYEWCHVDSRPGEGTVQIIKMPKGL